jgi:ornithine cyclodeaminase
MLQILYDEDIDRWLTAEHAVAAIELALRSKQAGSMAAPPRFSVGVETGALVFTAGAETRFSRTLGFRVYDTFGSDSPERRQLTVVYDSDSGAMKGLVFGRALGAMRTAAINAVAIKYMSRLDARTLGLLGSGYHARFQLRTAAAVRAFEKVLIYSPNRGRREQFAQEMTGELGLPVQAAETAERVVAQADVLVCATDSPVPVFDPAWLRPGVHINTIGPKYVDAHEVPVEAAGLSRVIATDSLAQVSASSPAFFLSPTDDYGRMTQLEDVVGGQQSGRFSAEDITLFCSVGLSGTEVVLADALLRLASGEEMAGN